MKKAVYTGSGVALVTPMKPDGSINYEKLDELLEFHIKNGTDAIVICATTGESPTLKHNEHGEAIEHTIKTVAGRIPVIASTGSNDTASALELSQHAKQAGADALLLVTPYYNKTSQAGLVRHYTYIADRVDLPMILYNVPARTGVNIKPETYFELSKHPNINGTKEANGDVAALMRTTALCGDNLNIYSGEDALIFPTLALGGKGVISVFANILPRQMHELCASYFAGDIEKSRSIALEYIDLMDALFLDINPIPVKAAMNRMGMAVGDCRMPLAPIGDAAWNTLEGVMKKHGLV